MSQIETTLNDLLIEDFKRRQEKNSSFSLRSYAKFLGIDSSLTSKILNKKRSLSSDLFKKISCKLEISTDEKELIEGMFNENNTIHKFRLKKSKDEFKHLNQQQFEIISDWHNYALLELIRTNDFRPDLLWISKKLGVTQKKLLKLITNLQSLNFLDIDKDGNWKDISSGATTHILPEDKTSTANKLYQKELLEEALYALKNIDITKRDQSSIMMATSSKKINEAKSLIKDFRRKLCAFLEDTEDLDTVYNVSISLFPLTKEIGK